MTELDSRRWTRIALAVALLPFVVDAVALVVHHGRYLPISDHALIELRIRDVGSHPVLTGLYSRDDWSHPGPLLFYAMAPLYRMLGSASIAVNLGALAINAAAISGMAVVARRLGGLPLALITIASTSLLVRTLGVDFVSDPWNLSITVLPFAFLVFLVWSLTCGETWALPPAAVVGTFLAQTHVGYVVLALPLVVIGAIGLVLPTGGHRRIVAATAVGTALLWTPVLIDGVSSSDNLGRIIAWFREAEDGTHTLAQGWRVISAQLSLAPEWLVTHHAPLWATGESAFLHDAPLPWLLPVVAVAAVVFRRARSDAGVRLIAVLAVLFAAGVVSVARTVGLVLDYRMRSTWTVGLTALVAIAWAAWIAAGDHPAVRRALTAVVVVALVGSASVSTVVAVRAETPRAGDTEALAAILPSVLDAAGGTSGPILVDDDRWAFAAWYTRSLVLQLERRGYDARLLPKERLLVGGHRVISRHAAAMRIVVAIDDEIPARDRDPRLRRLAQWTSVTDEQLDAFRRRVAALDRAVQGGTRTRPDVARDLADEGPGTHHEALAWRIAVYLDERASA